MAGNAAAVTVDLTTLDSYGFINDARFMQLDPDSSTGTGVIDSFLRVQATGTEKGYNTDGTFEYDEKNGTRALLLSEVAVVTINGTDYREFLLDVNETTPSKWIDLIDLTIHIETDPAISSYASLSTPIYDMNPNDEGNKVLLDYSLNAGSGDGDMLAHIPRFLFGTDETKYVYLYGEFSNATSDGFEEWAVADIAFFPEPATICLLILGSVLLLLRRRRFKRFV
ncbi:MAG: PEP-CTERM sorting domain-containing protein [Phycisphaerae bacterium]|nr:PEP-CTERM sorting domain-containing protein [Phycisphaerae bacterium]